LEQANQMILRIFSGLDFSLFGDWLKLYPYVAIIFAATLLMHWSMPKFYSLITEQVKRFPVWATAFLLVAVIFVAFQFQKMGSVPFYYLEF
jgi:hypothetical protein